MPDANLQPGGHWDIGANQVSRTLNVYRYPDANSHGEGTVGWEPQGGQLQFQQIAPGQTVSFAVNRAPGTFWNATPAVVRISWTQEAGVPARTSGTPHLVGVGTGGTTGTQSVGHHQAGSPSAAGSAAGPETAGTFEGGSSTHLATAGVMTSPAPRVTSAALETSNSPGEQAMAQLNAQWYNAVTTQCNLDPNKFQLVQGSVPLGATSEILWQNFDAIPPLSVTHLLDPDQLNSFSGNYGAMLSNIKQTTDQRFTTDMGDYLPRWFAYLQTSPTIPPGGMVQLFSNWSQLNIADPGQAQQCISDYQQAVMGVVFAAGQLWNAAGGIAAPKAYNGTVEQLKAGLRGTPSKSVSMDSHTQSSDISHTWAQGQIQGGYEFFSGSASASYDALTTSLTSAGVSISATFQNLSTFAAAPLAQTSSDPILSGYKPWFSGGALGYAYSNNNNLVWGVNPPSWQEFFGPSGTFLRYCAAVVVVDGIDITITSNVGFDSTQQQTFTAAASLGVWPFFSANASGGIQTGATYDQSGNVTVKSSSPLGNPIILGAIVSPINAAASLT